MYCKYSDSHQVNLVASPQSHYVIMLLEHSFEIDHNYDRKDSLEHQVKNKTFITQQICTQVDTATSHEESSPWAVPETEVQALALSPALSQLRRLLPSAVRSEEDLASQSFLRSLSLCVQKPQRERKCSFLQSVLFEEGIIYTVILFARKLNLQLWLCCPHASPAEERDMVPTWVLPPALSWTRLRDMEGQTAKHWKKPPTVLLRPSATSSYRHGREKMEEK